MRIEPKTFFANERTFISWLHMSITLSSIAVAMIAFSSGSPSAFWGGATLLPVSILFIIYAVSIFSARAEYIRRRESGPYDERKGPLVLSIILVFALVANFAIHLIELEQW